MAEKKKTTWHISKILIFAFAIVILPLGSIYYLTVGLDYYKDRLKELGDLGEVPAFEHINQFGDTLTAEDLKGKMTVFGYFSGDCGAPCDTFSTSFMRMHQAFPENYKIQFYTYYTDTAKTDLVQNLENGSRWFWLKGEPNELDDFFKNGLNMPVTDHYSNQFALVDSSMVVRRLYNAMDMNEVNRLVVHLSMAAPRPPKRKIQFRRTEEK